MNIEIDDFTLERFMERYIEAYIDAKIEAIFKHQLKGMVESRLAALRLSDPTFPSLDAHITEQLRTQVQQVCRESVPNLVRDEVRECMRNMAHNV